MSTLITLASLYAEVQVLSERISNLSVNLNEKHSQNRRDVHTMRNDIQLLSQQVWLIKLKLAAYAAGGSAIGGGTVVGIIKLIQHLAK